MARPSDLDAYLDLITKALATNPDDAVSVAEEFASRVAITAPVSTPADALEPTETGRAVMIRTALPSVVTAILWGVDSSSVRTD